MGEEKKGKANRYELEVGASPPKMTIPNRQRLLLSIETGHQLFGSHSIAAEYRNKILFDGKVEQGRSTYTTVFPSFSPTFLWFSFPAERAIGAQPHPSLTSQDRQAKSQEESLSPGGFLIFSNLWCGD